jgi:hypothetical protein
MYEATNPRKRLNFFRRHLFVIGMIVVGLGVTAIVVGVLIVKVVLSKQSGAVSAADQGVITTTDATGGLHTTSLPTYVRLFIFPLEEPVLSFLSQILSYLATHTATPTPTP